MRATLWAHFSLGIVKFDTLPTPLYILAFTFMTVLVIL